MSHERLKAMKERAMCLAEQGLNRGVEEIDANELGEIIDVVKDLAEAAYYCSITEAMEKTDEEEKYMQKYLPEMSYARNYNEMMYPYYDVPPKMYYRTPNYRPRMNYSSGNSGGNMSSGSNGGRMNYGSRMNYPDWHDINDGRSWETRRNYMDGKDKRINDEDSMKNLEEYAKDLTEDLMELVEEATPQEKHMLKQKLTMLASKIEE